MRSSNSSNPIGSSRPGVSYSSTSGRPSTSSTVLDVPGGRGRSETSPNAASRVSVRTSEVLPVLVWPTIATFRAGSFGLIAAPPFGLQRQVEAAAQRLEPGAD